MEAIRFTVKGFILSESERTNEEQGNKLKKVLTRYVRYPIQGFVSGIVDGLISLAKILPAGKEISKLAYYEFKRDQQKLKNASLPTQAAMTVWNGAKAGFKFGVRILQATLGELIGGPLFGLWVGITGPHNLISMDRNKSRIPLQGASFINHFIRLSPEIRDGKAVQKLLPR